MILLALAGGTAPRPPSHEAGFDGLVDLEDLAPLFRDRGVALPDGPLRPFLARFSSGACTHWHTHDGGQLLIGVSGSGVVAAADDAEPLALEPGTAVWVEPGERHRHGARPGRDFVQLSFTAGETHWEEHRRADPPASAA